MNKDNSLTNFQLIDILKKYNIKINGIYMKDELPDKLSIGFYICNLQSSYQGNGSHWTALYYNPKLSVYFDSYGFIPPLEIEQKIKPYVYNNKDIQNYQSSSCGYFCVAFIKYMYKSTNIFQSYNEFETIFSNDTEKNDAILRSILKY
jgi:hypothetical protein